MFPGRPFWLHSWAEVCLLWFHFPSKTILQPLAYQEALTGYQDPLMEYKEAFMQYQNIFYGVQYQEDSRNTKKFLMEYQEA